MMDASANSTAGIPGALPMFRINMLGKKPVAGASDTNGDEPGAQPPAPAGAMPEQLAQNLKTQGNAMVQYGARLLVIRELLSAFVVGLPATTRANVERSFCARINQLMSLTDDHVLPAEFHRALLAEVNYYLGELRKT
jgi:hypothetical protein